VDKVFPKEDIDIFGYESPIQRVIGQIRMETEDNIVRVIQEQSVNVDKDELIKALQYDRDQYNKGYVNGYNHKAYEATLEVINKIKKLLLEYFDSKDREYTTMNIKSKKQLQIATAHYQGATNAVVFALNTIAELEKKYMEDGK
jgi:hypothetical protein